MDKRLLEYLKTYRIMALATFGDPPWMCWVLYIIDNNFNLYFVSHLESNHAQDIKVNKKVACGITDTIQDPTGEKKGVQLAGDCVEITTEKELHAFFSLWKSVINQNETKVTYENYKSGVMKTRVFKVKPKKIKWFNQSLPEKEYILTI